MEFALGLAIVAGIGVLFYDVATIGYLPAPFFHDKNDTFMDWYNPTYWAHKSGAYSEYFTVYPPLSFLFLDLFSRPSCYFSSGFQGRDCDPQGYVVITIFLLVNVVLAYLTFRKHGSRAALPRSIALGLGTSMLNGWERGNLIIPCFTFFILAYGNLVKQGWLKVVFAAVTVNFKPYLIVAAAGHAVRRDWRWLEGFGLACVAVYAASYAVFGEGTPFELIADLTGFSQAPESIGYDTFEFSATYTSLLRVLDSSFPIVNYIGSTIIERLQLWLPVLMRGGALAVAACLLGGLLRPGTLSRTRLAALTLSVLFTTVPSPGGYSLGFMLFFVFFEPWRGPGRIVALIAAYIWCIPLDIDVSGLTYANGYSFIGQRMVSANMPITLGQLARPALVLSIEYGLVAASIGELLRRALSDRRAIEARRGYPRDSGGSSPPTSDPLAAG